ncbi:extracellular solute-binding protein [Bacteroidota bacterium]
MNCELTNRFLIIILIISSLILGCNPGGPEVVVYVSVDRMYAEPILKRFEDSTGISVRALYDVEAAKTTGLVNRLIVEKEFPRADLFWNGEFAQTIRLKKEDVLAPYNSPNAKGVPENYKDKDHFWTGFCGRARILIINTDMVERHLFPLSIFDLLDPDFPIQETGIAYPLFGTTFTHAAAIYALLGEEEGRVFFEELYKKGIKVAPGNSTVRDLVAGGELAVGFTDTDDACGALKRNKPVAVVYPDQDSIGTLIIPNTVALVAGGPNPDQAKRLIDFLLDPSTETELLNMGWSQVLLRPGSPGGSCLGNSPIRGMNVSLEEIYLQMDQVKRDMSEIFVK